ncbi:CHAT domain-containing protein [Actinomadura decatromicini]|uniref:CHAT domain-containing protein n=1 Tax=Actinomadura decatromicini TaxID=2604572 RepID=A0A5D3FGH9_9ACTN|nr:CHAT domain-containing protein [Actinomadura decatromicini]TYK46940.1 CHAT domain-containing protein [Actinomadura decatromicini]
MGRTDRLARVRDRVDRYNSARDAGAVLAPEAVADAVALICAVPDATADIEVAHATGWLFWLRFAARGPIDGEADLDIALALLTPVHRLSPEGIPTLIRDLFDDEPRHVADGPGLLARLGRSLHREASRSDAADALDQAIVLFRRGVVITETGHAEYRRCLADLSSSLLTRFDRTESPADLREAVEFGRAAVDAAASDDPDRATYLSNLGNALLTRFECFGGDPADLDAAVEAGLAAVTGWPDHPDHAAMASDLDRALRTKAAHTDRASDLDKRIASLCASPGNAARLSEFGGLLMARFQHSGDPADLDDAVQALRDAVASANPAHAAEQLAKLSDALRLRFVRTGREQDLLEAVEAARTGLAAAPDDHPDLRGRRSTLARALAALRDGGQVDAAVALARDAAADCPPDDPGRASYLSNLCYVLRRSFERGGDAADLEAAIAAGREAVATARHPELPSHLGDLGAALLCRFRSTGGRPDLDASVDAFQRAVDMTPETGLDRGTKLAKLGAALRLRYDATHRREDIDAAVGACREAVPATPSDHANRADRLSDLGAALRTRFAISDDRADIDEAVDVARDAAEAVPPGNPRRAPVLNDRALALQTRYDHTGHLADLDEAVDSARTAAEALAPDHPDHAGYLVNLARGLGARYARLGEKTDLDEALAACRTGAAAELAPSRIRAAAAALWGRLAAKGGRWEDAVSGFTATVDLLGRTVPHGLERRDQDFPLDGTVNVGSDAAACCVRAGRAGDAIELFERSRGLLLDRTLNTRTDLTALTARHPKLAKRFRALCTELDPEPGDSPVSAATAAERRAVVAELDGLVQAIRELPGFECFLRPLRVRDLAPAEGHVVIVNVSEFRSAALILSADGEASAVPELTPGVVRAEAGAFLDAVGALSATRTWADGQRRMTRTLEWLWDAVAGPVLHHLGIIGPPGEDDPWPRLWWCPSGFTSILPLHAAGYHGGTSGATVIDRVVCSTVPTIRALTGRAAGSGEDRAVAVAMPRTPGNRPEPPVAEAEASLLQRHFPGEVSILTGTAATHGAVLAALPKARWAHFACHGHTDLADPASSHLLLSDHPLTVADLPSLRLNGAELAFLSACSTARPGARPADEAIHLASAFQLAGYRHVIGTLWPVGDRHSADIADLIYSSINADACIAAAVHGATREMRDRWPDHPSIWASHIHVGE